MKAYPYQIVASVVGLLLLAPLGCGEPETDCELTYPDPNDPPEELSELCFFQGDPAAHEPDPALVPYDVTSELYADRSRKERLILLPEGEQIAFSDEDRWEFPVGSTIVKTFYYPEDARDESAGRHLLETRLLIRGEDQWEPYTYHWNEEQTEATRQSIGTDVEVEWIDEDGEEVTTDYMIPDRSNCKQCHADDGQIVELGPRTRQLNRSYDYGDGPVNQLEHFEERDMFDREVGSVDELTSLVDPYDDEHPVDKRARSYLDANCGHCHQPQGSAKNTAMYLNFEEDDPRHLGVCKSPIASGSGSGGNDYGIVPGRPDESIMVYRMETRDPEIKMPELPVRTVDEAGTDLIIDWIDQMEGDCNGE